MMDKEILLEKVSAGYGMRLVVKNASLRIRQGELITILGANGEGKTTLLKTICGLKKCRTGRIIVDQSDLITLSHGERARRIAYVPQNHIPGLPLSVRDMTVLGRQYCQGLFSQPGKEDYEQAERSLERMGLMAKADSLFQELSGGEQRLVLIARALTQSADFIILDEPVSNLDMGNQIKVLETLCRLSEEGKGIIMSSHFPQHCLWLKSQTVLMQKGKLCAPGKAEDVINTESLSRIYHTGISVLPSASGSSYCEPDFLRR